MKSLRLKTALLAAVSLTAASAALAPAADAAPVAPVAIEHAAEAADHGAAQKPAPATPLKGWAIYAGAAAALAALVRVIGFKRIAAATRAAAVATGDAAKAVVGAVASPVRFAALITGLALAAFAGVGFFDVEWLAGLAVGALFATTFLLGIRRARRVRAR